MDTPSPSSLDGVILIGTRLRCLAASAVPPLERSLPTDRSVTVVGVDATVVTSRAEWIALLHTAELAVWGTGAAGPHVVAVVQARLPLPVRAHHRLQRWAFSLLQRFACERGADVDVTVLVVAADTPAELVRRRVGELVRRPVGVNQASVLYEHEVRERTIAQAATADFI